MNGHLEVLECPFCHYPVQAMGWVSMNNMGAVYWTDGKMDGLMYDDSLQLTRCENCAGFFWLEDAKVLCIRFGSEIEQEHRRLFEKSRYRPRLSTWQWIDALEYASNWTLERQMALRQRIWWDINHLQRWNESEHPLFASLGKPSWADIRSEDAEYVTKEKEKLAALKLEFPNMPESTVNQRFHKTKAAVKLGRMDEAERIRISDCPARDSDFFRENLLVLRDLLDEGESEHLVLKAEIERELGSFDAALDLLRKPFPRYYEASMATIQERAEAGDAQVRQIPDCSWNQGNYLVPTPFWYRGPDQWKHSIIIPQDFAVRSLLAAGYIVDSVSPDMEESSGDSVCISMKKKTDEEKAVIDYRGKIEGKDLNDFFKAY